jgi:hypothetical protein
MSSPFYEIKDRRGTTAAVHRRLERLDGTKTFMWLRPDGSIGLNGTSTTELPLYNAEKIDAWSADEPLVVVEGEKVADALLDAGIPALGTVTGAASTPSRTALSDLAGRTVILAPDNDEAGRAHMRRIAARLTDSAVGWLEPPDGVPEGWDLADAIREGIDVRALLAKATAIVEPQVREGSERSERTPSDGGHSSLVSHQAPWPRPLAPEAFHGLAGAFVHAVEPHTEADPAAILLNLLTVMGALAGPALHAVAGDREHPGRLFGLVVGDTSKGRKDAASAAVERLARLVDPDFATVPGGLSSGEGLIYHVRDEVEKMVWVGRGAARHRELQVVDEGVEDKRLHVIESEFASVLRVIERDGNNLSTVLRTAWD